MIRLRQGYGGHVCQHFGTCGGCQTQDLPYPEQLGRKRQFVIELLGQFVPPALVAPVSPMPVAGDEHPWGFRHKAAFVFGRTPDGRGLAMGHYAQGTRAIVPVSECPVHADRANRIAFALRDRLAGARVPAAGPSLRDGILRHVIVRTTYNERDAVAMLVVTHNDRSLRRPVQAFLAGPDAPSGFFINIHDRPGPYMVGRETIRIAGRSHVREDHTGASFLVSPTAFFQTNPEGARLLVEEVMHAAESAAAAAPPGAAVLDLYSGSGLFAMPLARQGWRVTAVEENPQAMRDAEANARINDVPGSRLRLVPARVEQALQTINGRFEVVVLDPPRQGCSPQVIDEVFGRLAPRRAIYVSCDPTSLSRELPAIAAHGYRVSRALPVDMFPHTDHIELVATIEREERREARRR
jgi:23S rRNA (uracil1939-C5)-methyltransferase